MSAPRSVPAILALLGLALALAVAAPARADDDDAERAWHGARSGRLMPLPRIVEAVRQRFPGEVLDVDLDDDDGAPEYQIRLLMPNGRVLEVEVDGRTGRILDVDEDD
ncbi:PepSY domain-containing protein [Zavarzinia sp. CC-PAN008]|uniref:PepSY domain-containing protein n=1 Tax=Zavarzinia sp. CC-PAN008 TaxID=3243332 RepID=UPI003F744CF0